jgi:hypothetical protein
LVFVTSSTCKKIAGFGRLSYSDPYEKSVIGEIGSGDFGDRDRNLGDGK